MWKGETSNGDLAHYFLHLHKSEEKKRIYTLQILALTEHLEYYDFAAWFILRKFHDKFVLASRFTMAESTLRTILGGITKLEEMYAKEEGENGKRKSH